MTNALIMTAVALGLSAVASASIPTAPNIVKSKAAAQPGRMVVPVTRSAYSQKMEAEYRQLDADKNGFVTRKEIEDHDTAAVRMMLDNRRRALFAALDTDHNGSISAQEFARLPLSAPRIDASPLLNQADSNHDGQLSLAEYLAAKLGQYDRIDTDKNGVVTPAELKAAGLIK